MASNDMIYDEVATAAVSTGFSQNHNSPSIDFTSAQLSGTAPKNQTSVNVSIHSNSKQEPLNTKCRDVSSKRSRNDIASTRTNSPENMDTGTLHESLNKTKFVSKFNLDYMINKIQTEALHANKHYTARDLQEIKRNMPIWKNREAYNNFNDENVYDYYEAYKSIETAVVLYFNIALMGWKAALETQKRTEIEASGQAYVVPNNITINNYNYQKPVSKNKQQTQNRGRQRPKKE